MQTIYFQGWDKPLRSPSPSLENFDDRSSSEITPPIWPPEVSTIDHKSLLVVANFLSDMITELYGQTAVEKNFKKVLLQLAVRFFLLIGLHCMIKLLYDHHVV